MHQYRTYGAPGRHRLMRAALQVRAMAQSVLAAGYPERSAAGNLTALCIAAAVGQFGRAAHSALLTDFIS